MMVALCRQQSQTNVQAEASELNEAGICILVTLERFALVLRIYLG
jgi:hypothetical protein